MSYRSLATVKLLSLVLCAAASSAPATAQSRADISPRAQYSEPLSDENRAAHWNDSVKVDELDLGRLGSDAVPHEPHMHRVFRINHCPSCGADANTGCCPTAGAQAGLAEYLVPEPILGNAAIAREKLAVEYWGMKEPLHGTSWMNRPLHVDWFFGHMSGDELISGHVDQGSGLFGGYRLGWDFEPQWGAETRLGFAAVDLDYEQRPGSAGTGDLLLWDASLVYYPWPDSHWRPYWTAGLGVVNVYAQDDRYGIHDDTIIGMPIGGGLKYYYRNWLALRVDLLDNIAFGGGDISLMHNLSLTAGVEVRFGGSRPSYWPWNPAGYVR